MSDFNIIIVGGHSFSKEVEDLFKKYNIDITHYNARKSSDLKKQKIPVNTIGAIITIDRSHMAFGNSNELVRNLKNKNIPFIFSSGNFASLNSSNYLLGKIKEVFPDKIKEIQRINKHEIKLENSKQELKNLQDKFTILENKYKEHISKFKTELLNWKKILDDWKFFLLELKENEKLIPKSYKNSLNNLYIMKERVHDLGIKCQSQFDTIEYWTNKSLTEEHDLLLKIILDLNTRLSNINNIKDKELKNDFKLWQNSFLELEEKLDYFNTQLDELIEELIFTLERVKEWTNGFNILSQNFIPVIQNIINSK